MARGPRRPRQSARVRIIAGEWRGRHIEFDDAEGLRPTGDRVRETLFNWLQSRICGARCLDLFAGSGALGFEAASRGAATVVMVEQNPQTVARLRRTIAQLDAARVTLRQTSALELLSDTAASEPFDLIFLDPPFATELLQRCLDRLRNWPGLAIGGSCYVEFPESAPPRVPDEFGFLRRARAGEVGFGLLQRR